MKTYYQQINDIKMDIGRIANELSAGVAREAEKDLIKAHTLIIDAFYAAHDPSSYRRHGIGGLYYSLQSHIVEHVPGKYKNKATVIISPADMEDHYRTTTDVVFDLMWNKGVRGLPRKGLKPLERDFVQNNQYPFNAGQIWENPYWSGEGTPYHNIFRTSIKIGSYQSIYQVPNNVMRDIVENWDKANGISACEKIVRSLK